MGVTSFEGSISHKSLADDASESQLKKHAKTVEDLLERVTKGEVTVTKGIAIAQLRCEFILSLNSLAFEQEIRAAVGDLSIPWEIERTEHRGLRRNLHSIASGGFETNFPTLIISRRGLYVPETGTCKLVFAGMVIVAGFAFCFTVFQWLMTM